MYTAIAWGKGLHEFYYTSRRNKHDLFTFSKRCKVGPSYSYKIQINKKINEHLYTDSIGLQEPTRFMKLVYRVKSFLPDLLYQKGSKKLCDVILFQKSYTLTRLNLLTWH